MHIIITVQAKTVGEFVFLFLIFVMTVIYEFTVYIANQCCKKILGNKCCEEQGSCV